MKKLIGVQHDAGTPMSIEKNGTAYSQLVVFPSEAAPRRCHVTRSMLSLIEWVEPSTATLMTTPGCLLRGG